MRLHLRLAAGFALATLAALVIAVALRPASPFVGTVAVGASPNAVTVDPRTGHLFVATSRNQTVTMLATASGQILRQSIVPGVPVALRVAERAQRALVLLDPTDQQVAATVGVLDTATGTLLRTVNLGPGARDDPTQPNGTGHIWLTDLAVDDQTGHIFVVAGGPHGETAYMLDARSGRVLRATRVGANPSSVALDPRTHRAFVVNTDDDTVSILDTRSGRRVGTRHVGIGPLAVTVDAETGRAFVTNSADATVSVLETRTGRVLRTVAVVSNPQTLVAVPRASRVVILSEDSGTVSVLDAQTGTVLHTIALGARRPVTNSYASPVYAVAEARDERVFILDSGGPARGYQAGPIVTQQAHGGAVSVLDALRGRVVGHWPVGLSPIALAIDEPMRRLVVANADGGRPPAPITLKDRLWGWLPPALRPLLPWRPLSPMFQGGSVTVLDETGA